MLSQHQRTSSANLDSGAFDSDASNDSDDGNLGSDGPTSRGGGQRHTTNSTNKMKKKSSKTFGGSNSTDGRKRPYSDCAEGYETGEQYESLSLLELAGRVGDIDKKISPLEKMNPDNVVSYTPSVRS